MCSQCGLKPQEVLDLSFDVVQACIAGYSDRMLDEQLVAVQAGYWAAYYSGMKHPKPVGRITEDMIKAHKKSENIASKASAPKPEVDVEAFLAMEEQFRARLVNG